MSAIWTRPAIDVHIDFDAAEVVVAEPLLELTKDFAVETADAGDILTVTVTATNNGTAPAYNPRILDDLTGVDFSYVGNVGGTNPPTNIDTTTYGPDSPVFSWDPGYEIPIGGQVSFTFDVQVGDTVQPLQVLENTIQADWTSLPGRDTALNSTGQIGADGAADGMRIGALPNAGNALNDYEAEASDSVYVPPLGDHQDRPRPGAAARDRRAQALPGADRPAGRRRATRYRSPMISRRAASATSSPTTPTSTSPTNSPASPASTASRRPRPRSTPTPPDGASGMATWNIGSVVTETEDDSAVNDITPYIRATYSARINNDLVTDVGDTLQNSATAYYTNGDTGAQDSVNDTTAPITATEPSLTAATALTNVTPGKNAGDPLAFGDIAQYVLTVPNFGNAIAHDVNIVDTLPPELAFYAGYVPIAQVNGIDVAGFVPTPTGAPGGPLVWGAGNNDTSLDVPPGATLELTYQVEVIASPDPSIPLSNSVWVDWTSLDELSGYERTGAGCPNITAPNDYCYGPASADGTPVPIQPPGALAKANTQDTATIGETFSYRITVPSTPYPVPLFDVRIIDNLNASAADLTYVSVTKVSGSAPWTPVNTGDAKNLVIEDTTTGIDIAPGEQIVLDITVRLDDTPVNIAGLTFTNTADYTYNRLNDAPATILGGTPGTSQPMTVVEPDLTLEKTGPPQMQLGVPGTFTLNVHNVGGSPANNLTIYDVLPNQADGGMCDAAPTAVTAQVFEANGTTAVSPVLAEGTRLHRRVRRRSGLQPDHHDADAGRRDRRRPAPDRHLPGPARHRQPAGREPHERQRRHRVVQHRRLRCRQPGLRAHLHTCRHRRHGRHARPRGRAHGRGLHAGARVREVRDQRNHGREPGHGRDAGRQDPLRPARRERQRHAAGRFQHRRRARSPERPAGLPAGHAERGHGPGRRHRRLQPERRHRGHRPARYQRPLARRHRRQPAHRVRGRPCAGDRERHLRLQPVHRRVRRLPGRGQ